MQKMLEADCKIFPLAEVEAISASLRQQGKKIVHCHGVFDLLHPGHIRHLRKAKSLGDCLIVTVTPDHFVNKGPGRPAFQASLRLESLAALLDVDFVVLNDAADAVGVIQKIRPHFYVKGEEYEQADLTGKIGLETEAVLEGGGEVVYTREETFSSSSLINQFFDSSSETTREFLKELKATFSLEEILHNIEALSSLKVLVVGDAILDDYQYVEPLGQSGKGLHMVARCKERETFLGGSLIVANHVAQFAGEVTLLTALGKECPYLGFALQTLDPKVCTDAIYYLGDTSSLIKKRYVLKEGRKLTKLFETYSGQEETLNHQQTEELCLFLQREAKNYDLVLVCDFGNGFTNRELIHELSRVPCFLALNTQTNSGNRGFNVVTHYARADYISINEPELRLAAHDPSSALEGIASDVCNLLSAQFLSVTRGVNGVFCFAPLQEPCQIPAFSLDSVDRIGAGDTYLSLSSLCLAKGYSMLLAGFIGSVAAAMNVQFVGNKEHVKKSALQKFIVRLLK